jgi:hypothetical protein
VATVGYVVRRPVLCGLHLEGKTMNDEQQTQATDDPSGEGWRDVEVGEVLRHTDMFRDSVGAWVFTENKGLSVREGWERTYRRRIEPQQPEPQAINPDDPSGPGWRDVSSGEILHVDDMVKRDNGWGRTRAAGTPAGYQRYRRRIEQQQASDSEPETMEQLRKRLDAAVRQNVELADELANEQNKKGAYKAILKRTMERAREAEALVAEAKRSGQQVNAELQQLREQVATLTRERDRLQSSLRDHYRDGHQRATVALQSWLRPVLELVAEHPDDCGPLAVSVLGYLPSIAARLIEE